MSSTIASILQFQRDVALAASSMAPHGSAPRGLTWVLRSYAERLLEHPALLGILAGCHVAGLILLIALIARHFRIKEQLETLTDAAAAFGQGDRQARANLSEGPLANLGRKFDDMATLLSNEIRGLRNTQRELEQLVATDRLTGIGNRRLFEQQVEAECARARRYGVPASLILFDVDNFKVINDRYGHQVGDAVLVHLVRRVALRLRDTDCLARWGGEEFAILTPCTPIAGAQILAEKIRQIVAEQEFDVVGNVTISVGVAQLAQGETTGQWLARADEQLYQAKHAGRNRVRVDSTASDLYTHFVLIWGDQFLVHHADIDAEHAELFRLANELVLAPEESSTKDALARFDTLFDHIEQHFRHEEQVLAEHACPEVDLQQHVRLHQGLLARGADMRRRLTKNSLGVSDIGDFVVRRLVVGHLLNADLPLFSKVVPNPLVPDQPQPRPSLRLRIQRAILG